MPSSGVHDVPLDPAAVTAAVLDDSRGACVCFQGIVRDHDRGRTVTRLEYSAHPGATDVLAQIVAEVEAEFDVRAAAQHRVGGLAVGDLALVAACSAAHRAEAFAACTELVERVKHRLPVWKRQLFADGEPEWVGLDA